MAKRVHTFSKVSQKLNVVVQLDFKLAYYDVVVQLVSHYATETRSQIVVGYSNPN